MRPPPRPKLGRFLLITGFGLALLDCRSPGTPPQPEPPPAAAPNAPAPEERAAAPKHDAQASEAEGVEILLEESRVAYDASGRQSRTFRQKYRIVDDSAIDGWGTIAVEWAPWHEKKPSIKARVTAPDGRVFELDPKNMDEAPAAEREPNMFSDRRVLRAPLPGLTRGALVEAEMTVVEEQPLFEGGSGGTFTFGSGVPVAETRLVIDVPDGLELHYAARGPAPRPKEAHENGRRVLTFDPGPAPTLEDLEPYSPFDQPTWPQIYFSTGPAWPELARRYGEVVERQLAGNGVRRMVEAALGGEKLRERVIARLLAKLHERVRYTGLELGDAAIVPRRPDETLARGYGDCKDKATLLVAMLRAAGIEAHVALIRSGFAEDAVESVPDIGSFNHAIVYLPAAGKAGETWIDATFEEGRAGELPLELQGHHALVAREGSSGLSQIPPPRPTENTYLETREVFLAPYGPARIVEESEGTRAIEHGLRARLAKAKDEEIKKSLKRYVAENYLADAVSKVERFGAESLEHPFKIRLTFDRARRGETTEAEAAVHMTAGMLLDWMPSYLASDDPEPDPNEAGEVSGPKPRPLKKRARRNDLLLFEPYVAELRYHIVPATGFVLRNLPEDHDTPLGPALLTQRYTKRADGAVDASFRFDTRKGRYTPAEVAAYLEALPKLEGRLEQSVTFDYEPARLIAAGKVRDGLALHRKIIAAEPREALHHARFASALLEAGFGEAARKEGKVAVGLDPKCWYAQFTLGWVLGHDLFGRADGPGADHRGAVEAYQKAKALEPKDFSTRRNLAVTLEYDGEGRRYGPGARVDEAVAEYQALAKDLKNESMTDSLMILLMRAGRAEALRTLAKGRPRSPVRDELLLVATMLLEGRAGMQRELANLGLDPAAKQRMLSATVFDLMSTRQYAAAAELAADALEGSPNIVAEGTRLAMLKKLRRYEAVIAEKKGPEGVAYRFTAEVFAGTQLAEALAADARFMSSAAVDEAKHLLAKGTEETRALSAAVVRAARRGSSLIPGADPLFLLDLTTSMAETHVDGSDRVGYRVVMRQSLSDGKATYFVVREGGAYKIRTSLPFLNALGAQALTLADHGDLAAARQWLDWAREEVEPTSGDDPFLGDPFADLWTKGQDAKIDQIRVAAAALMAEGPATADHAFALLKSARASAKDEQRAKIEIALLNAAVASGRFKDVVEIAGPLVEKYPRSKAGADALISALAEVGRADEGQRLADARLAASPRDPDAIGTVARSAARRGDFAKEAELERQLVDLGKATFSTYNALAWGALFRGSSLDAAVEDALRAVNMTQSRNYAALHTLATLYAEQGKTAEASSIFKKVMDVHGGEPRGADWYIVGRIAEEYELIDVAKSAYDKVPRERVVAGSTRVLADRRLQALAHVERH